MNIHQTIAPNMHIITEYVPGYNFSGESCSSEAILYDGVARDNSDNLLRHICGPVSREPKDEKGKFLQPEFLLSSSNLLEIHIKFGEGTDRDRQFLAGAYQFHNSKSFLFFLLLYIKIKHSNN